MEKLKRVIAIVLMATMLFNTGINGVSATYNDISDSVAATVSESNADISDAGALSADGNAVEDEQPADESTVVSTGSEDTTGLDDTTTNIGEGGGKIRI